MVMPPPILEQRIFTPCSSYNTSPLSSFQIVKFPKFVNFSKNAFDLVALIMGDNYFDENLVSSDRKTFALFLNEWRIIHCSEQVPSIYEAMQSTFQDFKIQKSIDCFKLLTGCICRSVKNEKITHALSVLFKSQNPANTKPNQKKSVCLVKMR